MTRARIWRLAALGAAMALIVAFTGPAGAAAHSRSRGGRAAVVDPASFATGEVQAQTVGSTGCGTNTAGEPAIKVSRAGNLFAGSEEGLGNASEVWRQLSTTGGAGASACALEYRGQPNAVTTGVGASGGDIDIAVASAPNTTGNYNVYVASLNLASVNVATSADNGATFTQSPVQAGIPIDDREWIAAYGAQTSLLTYHDVASDEIDVLRSDNGGTLYHEISFAIAPTSPAATSNEHGNIVIDHRNTAGTATNLLDTSGVGGFWAYQSYVGPTSSSDANLDEMFVAVSNDGGYSWTDRPIGCSMEPGVDLAHNFPNVSVAPDGTLWAAWSDDTHVFTATSADHGSTWTCSGPISTGLSRAVFPWLAATAGGVDLVYYGTTDATGPAMTWSVYFQQDGTSAPTGWGAPQAVVAVHRGDICESGISCSGGRQLFDDFGIDTDGAGNAHVVYSHDAPALGGAGSYTGYAVQTGGTVAGAPNN
jgi:hypothetical protein